MKDPYNVLGVAKTATQDEIKKAYRKLASKHHPDKGGDTSLFQEIQSAYETLNDPAKRAQYDNAQNFTGFGFGAHSFNGMRGNPFDNNQFDLNSIFDMFGTRFQQQRPQVARITLWITLEEVATGGAKTIGLGTAQGHHAVEVNIPKGVEDGMNVQYTGIAPGGIDLVVQYRINPHPIWQRDKNNLITEKSISIWDLILGCEVPITTLTGQSINLKIHPNTQPGTVLRLKNLGITSHRGIVGDALVKVQGFIPKDIGQDLIEMIRKTQTR